MKPIVFVALLLPSLMLAQPGQFSPRGIGGGGALFFPAINPANDDEFYISCDMSQLFHSLDFGASYDQFHFTRLTVMNVASYEFTADPLKGYAMYNDGNDGYPVRTADGGLTWKPLPGYNAGLGKVYRIKANPAKTDQILLNYYGDIVLSNDGGNTFTLVKHTVNNGAGLIMGGVVFDGNNIYIGTNEGLLYTSNNGATFAVLTTTGIPAGQVIWQMAGARKGNTLRFACITAAVSDTYNGLMPWDYYNHAKGVFLMDNASGVWSDRSAGINFASDFAMYIGMALNDVNTIYLAGNDNALSAPLVLKSADGGTTWGKVFRATNNQNIRTGWSGYQGDKNWSWGETCFGIAVAPYNSDKILFGDYGFVHTSKDGGKNWQQAYVNKSGEHPANAPTPQKQAYGSIGLENTTCWQVAWISPSSLFAAFSDIGGIRSTDKGNTWSYNYAGFSVNSLYRLAKHPNGTLYGACSNIHDMYQSTRLRDAQLDANDANGKIVYSADGGNTWATLHQFNHPVFWIAADPANPKRLYASVIHYGGGGAASQGGIWVCNDLDKLAASTWSRLPAPPRTEGHPAAIEVLKDGSVLCTYSGRINASGAFTASSGVFVYTPATGTWKDVSDPGMLYWTKDIVPDPGDSTQQTWYAGVFSGWGGAPNGKGGLYRTTNRGTTWTRLTGTNFDRVTSLTFDPARKNRAYLTTETQGLWMSNDMDKTVPSWNLVAAYPFRQPERVYFNPYDPTEMWVTSFGNGMRMGTSTPTAAEALNAPEQPLLAYPNPAGDILHLRLPLSLPPKAVIRVFDSRGNLVTALRASEAELSVECGNWPSGLYWIEAGNQVQQVVKR